MAYDPYEAMLIKDTLARWRPRPEMSANEPVLPPVWGTSPTRYFPEASAASRSSALPPIYKPVGAPAGQEFVQGLLSGWGKRPTPSPGVGPETLNPGPMAGHFAPFVPGPAEAPPSVGPQQLDPGPMVGHFPEFTPGPAAATPTRSSPQPRPASIGPTASAVIGLLRGGPTPGVSPPPESYGAPRVALHANLSPGLRTSEADWESGPAPLPVAKGPSVALAAAGNPFSGLSRTSEADWAASPAVAPPAHNWRDNSAIIHRGLAAPSVYVGRQPRPGVQGGASVADPYAGLLDQASQPFAPTSGEYDLGGLQQAEADWNRGLDRVTDRAGNSFTQSKALPILEAQAKRDVGMGQVQADQTRARAALGANEVERTKADYVIAQGQAEKTANPQQVAAQGQADMLKGLIDMAPGAIGADGKLPPARNFLEAYERYGKGPIEPGSPQFGHLMASPYGPEIEARRAGKDVGVVEPIERVIDRLVQPILPWKIAPSYGQRMKDLVRRNIRVRPGAQPGVWANPSPSRASLIGR